MDSRTFNLLSQFLTVVREVAPMPDHPEAQAPGLPSSPISPPRSPIKETEELPTEFDDSITQAFNRMMSETPAPPPRSAEPPPTRSAPALGTVPFSAEELQIMDEEG